MSGQYKIRRNNQDDFSDRKTGYNIAKRGGGCLENIKSCLGLIILLTLCGLIIVAFTDAQNAQALDDSCFPHKTLYTVARVELRDGDSRFAKELEKTRVNKTYTVVRSYTDWLFGSCWIQTTRGWLLRRPTGSVIKPGAPPAQQTDSTSATHTTTTSPSCYSSSKAYITGTMNIRSGPSTENSKVGSASLGDSFTVSQSQREGDYCWLKIGKGWIAQTGRVQSTKPAVKPSSDLPPIEGSELFRQHVIEAFEFLRTKSPKWFDYTTPKIRKVVESSSSNGAVGWVTLANRNANHATVSIRGNSILEEGGWPLYAVLVHEACHIHQWNDGKYQKSKWFSIDGEDERECFGVQAQAMSEIVPNDPLIPVTRCFAKKYPYQYVCRGIQ